MKIEHVAMYVRDLEIAKEFFITYFGAAANDGYYNQHTGFRSYFLSFDSNTRLEIMSKPECTGNEKDLFCSCFCHAPVVRSYSKSPVWKR